MFYIQVNDPQGKRYVLDAYIETDGNYKEIYIGNTCVRLLIKEGDSEAVLEDFNTRKSCDINRYLLMGALKYLVKTYNYVKTVHLSDIAVGIGDADDNAQKKGTRVYLTPKRLLLGKPGWYEEYFGAKPIQKTDLVIQTVLRKLSLTPEDINRISKKSWGTTKDIEELNPEAKNSFIAIG